MLRDQKSDASLSPDDQSMVSAPAHELLEEIKDLTSKRKFNMRVKQKKIARKVPRGEMELTVEEEAYLKAQPPGYKLYTNQWGKPVYELKIKNEFKYMWEWVPIAIPKSAEQPEYMELTKVPLSLELQSFDSNDPALILSTKEHNEKFIPLDLFDKPIVESKWKRRQKEFSHLPKEVRQRYLNCVQRYVWEYYRAHPKGGRPEKLIVHIPLGDIEEEYLYFINKQKTKTSRRLKEKLNDIEKQLGINANNKRKPGKLERRKRI